MITELIHAKVFLNNHEIPDSHIVLQEGVIQSVGKWQGNTASQYSKIIDASNWTASAGWIDIQLNGGFGYDFTEQPEKIWEVAAQIPQYGTTSFLPTIITAPMERYQQAIDVLRAGPPAGWKGAVPLGLHIEGPFLNPGKKGAHNPNHLKLPDLSGVQDWSRKNGVFLVTLAPELPGALEIASSLMDRDVVVSAGHSLATYEQAEIAFHSGFDCATHLFNAMPALDHRAPGLTGAILDHTDVKAGIIADGIHVHPALLRTAWQCNGPARLMLITDAMAALGMAPGTYKLGDQTTLVDTHTARLQNGTLAGSILTQEQALQNMMRYCNATAAEILPTLTSVPAGLFRLTNKGSILPGMDADLTLINENGVVQMTFVSGQLLYSCCP